MLKLENIHLTRGDKHILNGISLEINKDICMAITGPNGSGKSTLVKVIMGIEKPDSGRVVFNGIDITKKTIDERARMGLGFSFQQPCTFKGITVRTLLNLSSDKELTTKECCGYLATVGLCAKGYVDREIDSTLSGGEIKRIEIASVLARNSTLSLFDEPEAGIDLWSFKNLIEVFNSIKSEHKGSIIIISHQERILNIADKVVMLHEGSVQSVSTKGDRIDIITTDPRKCILDGHLKECMTRESTPPNFKKIAAENTTPGDEM
ncbi:MAG TPA: ATP-binding cassette domain-containing protein [Treponemataceae bacterium]|nr:ATP-binding cassette domain-containing protein [Treponemataceae bacterium]